MITIIIVEGVDNTGKTELVKKLVDKYPQLKQIAVSPPKITRCDKTMCHNDHCLDCYPSENRDRQDLYVSLVKRLLEWDDEETQYLIFDRFMFSESVYGPLLRGGTAWSEPDERDFYNTLLVNHMPLIIHCKRTPAQVIKTFYDRKQLEGVSEKLIQIMVGYEQLMKPFSEYQWFVEYDFDNEISVKRTELLVDSYLG